MRNGKTPITHMASTEYCDKVVRSMMPSVNERGATRLRIGIICSKWPGWLFAFRHSSYHVIWILFANPLFQSLFDKIFKDIQVKGINDNFGPSGLEPVDVVCFNGPLSFKIRPPTSAVLMFYDWNIRSSFGKDWKGVIHKIKHWMVGGVTNCIAAITVFVHVSHHHIWSIKREEVSQDYPIMGLSRLLNITESGALLPEGLRLPTLNVPEVRSVCKNIFHYAGLYPITIGHPLFAVPSVYTPGRYVKRKVTLSERFQIWDIPVSVINTFPNGLSRELVNHLGWPHKCYWAVVQGILGKQPITLNGGGVGVSIFPSSLSSSNEEKVEEEKVELENNRVDLDVTYGLDSLPSMWRQNYPVENMGEEAVKHDNASVPVSFWNRALCRKLGLNCLSLEQKWALDIIRLWSVEKLWRRSITKCFCLWLKNKAASRKSIQLLFDPKTDFDKNSDPDFIILRRFEKNLRKFKVVKFKKTDGDGCGKYEWARDGLKNYKRFYNLFLKLKQNSKTQRHKDVEGGRECIWRTTLCSVWKWDFGSRLLFWRWGEFIKSARDGPRVHFHGPIPKCRKKQSAPSDPVVLKKIRNKLEDVRQKRYIDSGQVDSVTSFFSVPKGEEDIRMVYNATSSGLNDAVWCPWFALPTVETHLRAVEEGTFMADCDVGEMFLNFLLHDKIRKLAGVDLSEFYPSECPPGGKLWERWTRLLMGFRPAPYLTTREMRRVEPFLKGDRCKAGNPFEWDYVKLNLPGNDAYNPSKPRVYKIRKDGKIAGDLFVYIDDLRITGVSEESCWEGAHQVSSRMSWLGMQDAPRKRRRPSLEPGAWAGTVVHSSKGEVSVLIGQKKWDKTKLWIDWMSEHVEDEDGMDHKELERCRGFLVYVSRTYRPMKPYLRGIHKTIDSWRPGRDSEGWKSMKVICELHMKTIDETPQLNKLNRENIGKVKPVPRFKRDICALMKMTRFLHPPKVLRRLDSVGIAAYGFGDASGMGFGHALCIAGVIRSEYGQWNSTIEEKHSNYKELRNLVNAVKAAMEENVLDGIELFLFTDNFVAECSYHNGGSNTCKELNELIFQLWKMQMEGCFILHVYHVAGTRMIATGIDGLSRGDKSEGIMNGLDIRSFIPLHLRPTERCDHLRDWIESLWKVEHRDNLTWLSEHDWFQDSSMIKGNFVWDVPPAAGEVAVELLCSSVHCRPHNLHLFIIPRLCTGEWRKQLMKCCDVFLTIDPIYEFWPPAMHEPLIMGIYLPLLPPDYRYRPWKLRNTVIVEEFEIYLRRVQKTGVAVDWDILREFLFQARTISSLPNGMARKLLQEKGSGSLPKSEVIRK